MATILRSSKYIRCLNLFTRRTVVDRANGNYTAKFLAPQLPCINSYLTKSYATVQAAQRFDNVSIEKYIAKLDESVQRYGRVYKLDVNDVLSKIRESGVIPSLDGLLLIRCCGELMVDAIPEVRSQMVQEIWNTLEALRTPMDVSHFNALLRVYLENNYDFSPIEFLTLMKDKGIEPNRITYQRLILHKCKRGDIEGATGILEFMREKDLPLNEGVFNALIIGHSEANDMESAKNILNVMKNAGVEPCVSTYAALLTAYATKGDMDSIKNLITECESKELYLHDTEYFDVIQALAAKGYNEEIDEMLSVMSGGPSYNTNAFRAILKVLDVGNVDAALKILSTMKKRRNVDEDSEESESGSFLIRKMVNSKFPIDKVIQACEYMKNQGLHTKAFSLALERSLSIGYTDLSVSLIKSWNKHGGTIRQHFFWPILVCHGKDINYQGIEDVIKFMITDLKVMPGIETVTEYILPYTLGSIDDTIVTLKDYHIPPNTIMSSIAIKMLMDRKIRKTVTFLTNNPSDYEVQAFHRPLAEALKYSEDVRSFVAIVRLLHDSVINRLRSETADGESSEESKHLNNEKVIDEALQKALLVLSPRKHAIVNQILDLFIQGGMNLSPEVGSHLRDFFDDNLTPEINEKIEKLTSGCLTPAPLSEFTIISAGDRSSENGDGHEVPILINSKFSAQRQQLSSFIVAKDDKQVQKLAAELEADGFNFSAAVYAQIISVFCEAGNVEQAVRWQTTFHERYPGVILDLQKSTSYAALLIKNGRLDDALKFILESPRIDPPESQGGGNRRLVKTLLNVAAETGNAEFTEKLFITLVEAKFAVVDNFMLGSLVKVHLLKNDLEGALNAFEKICKNYKCTPLKHELSKKFIDAEDANSLQLLTDLSTRVHGESNSLIDLVIAFVECGRLRQARKILETPGLRLRGAKLKRMAIRLIEDGNPQYLDQFIGLMKGLLMYDRQELQDVLVNVYSQKNDWQRGLNLWMEMQDENTQPSETFLQTLAELLEQNNQPIPFVHNNAIPVSRPSERNYITDFNEAIENGDLERAEKIVYSAPPNDKEFSTIASKLIRELLERQNDLDKATYIAKKLITEYSRIPRMNVLKALFTALMDAEKYDAIRSFENILSTNLKRKFRLDKLINRAALHLDGVAKYLNDFEAEITNLKSDNFELVKHKLHFTSIINEIKKDPSVLDHFVPTAKKLADQQIYLPINLVWSYYFEESKPEADEIWFKYLANADWIAVSYLTESCKKRNDIELLERLHHRIMDNKSLPINGKTFVISALIDMYIAKGRHEDALKALNKESEEVVCNVKLAYKNSILELIRGLEAKGQPIPSDLDIRNS